MVGLESDVGTHAGPVPVPVAAAETSPCVRVYSVSAPFRYPSWLRLRAVQSSDTGV